MTRTQPPLNDLSIIIVSTNEGSWLQACLTSIYEHAGAIDLDVVVVDNESTDGTRELVESSFPSARVVPSVNKGFSHANNEGLLTCASRFVLFLNPDTEILEGTFEALVAALDSRPDVGLAGVKQVTPDGELFPTIRRFPNAARAFGEAVWPESFGNRPTWLGERELRLERYDVERECDWTSGSFMFARREALASAGILDERSFIYSEEPDLCLRMKRDGWKVVHLPVMTILHHAGKAGISDKMLAQDAFSRLLYARKHFSAVHRSAYVAALAARFLARSVGPMTSETARQRRRANRRALRVLTGREHPPFGTPPPQAVMLRSAGGEAARADDLRVETAG